MLVVAWEKSKNEKMKQKRRMMMSQTASTKCQYKTGKNREAQNNKKKERADKNFGIKRMRRFLWLLRDNTRFRSQHSAFSYSSGAWRLAPGINFTGSRNLVWHSAGLRTLSDTRFLLPLLYFLVLIPFLLASLVSGVTPFRCLVLAVTRRLNRKEQRKEERKKACAKPGITGY